MEPSAGICTSGVLFALMDPSRRQTFSLQSLGGQFLGQLHKATVFLSDLLIICIQIFPFLGFLLRLRGDAQREKRYEDKITSCKCPNWGQLSKMA